MASLEKEQSSTIEDVEANVSIATIVIILLVIGVTSLIYSQVSVAENYKSNLDEKIVNLKQEGIFETAVGMELQQYILIAKKDGKINNAESYVIDIKMRKAINMKRFGKPYASVARHLFDNDADY